MNLRLRLLQIVIFFLILTLSCEYTFSSSTLFPTLPENYARTVTTNHGSVERPLIIHIQDAHAHYYIQKRIAELLAFYCNEYGSDKVLVAVEGASDGALDTKALSWFSTVEETQEVCERLMKKGKISGSDYQHALMRSQHAIDSSSSQPFAFYGIEDTSLYGANRNQYLRSFAYRGRVKQLLAEISDKLNILKEKYYTSDLQVFDAIKGNDSLDRDTVQTHMIKLFSFAFQYGIDLKAINQDADRSVLYELYELFQSMGNVDLEAVKQQTQRLVNALHAQKISFSAKADIVELHALAKENAIDMKAFYELDKYVAFSDLVKKVNFETLLEEKALVETMLYERMLDNMNARRLYAIESYITFLKELNELKMTRESEVSFESVSKELAIEYIYSFINYHLDSALIEGVEGKVALLNTLKEQKDFYDNARKRDHVLVENFLKHIETNAQYEVGILIVGGYHADGIEEVLQTKGYTFQTLLPEVNADDESITIKYEAAMRGDVDPLAQKVIHSLRGIVE